VSLSTASDFDQSPAPASAATPLVYHSGAVDVRPILEVTFPTDSGSSLPTQIQAQLTWNNGTPQSWVTFATTGHSAGGHYALAAQVSSAVNSTGIYPWQVQIDASFSDRGDVVRTVSATPW